MRFAIIVASLAVLGVISGAAYGDISARSYDECRAIKDSAKRLACFDGLSSPKRAVKPANITDKSPGKWKRQDYINPLNDQKSLIIVLAADTGRSMLGAPYKLFIRCCNDGMEVFVDFGEFVHNEDVRVISRFDKAKAFGTRWPVSADNMAIFYKGGLLEYLEKIVNSKRFIVQVKAYQGAKTAIFDTRGIKAAIRPLQKACSEWVARVESTSYLASTLSDRPRCSVASG